MKSTIHVCLVLYGGQWWSKCDATVLAQSKLPIWSGQHGIYCKVAQQDQPKKNTKKKVFFFSAKSEHSISSTVFLSYLEYVGGVQTEQEDCEREHQTNVLETRKQQTDTLYLV